MQTRNRIVQASVTLILALSAGSSVAKVRDPEVVKLPDVQVTSDIKAPKWEFQVPIRVCVDELGAVTSAAFDSMAWQNLIERPWNAADAAEAEGGRRARLRPEWAQEEADSLAILAAKSGVYRPATDGDRAVSGCVTAQIVFNRGKKLTEPVLRAIDEPHYPKESRETGEQGVVLIHVLVNTVGLVDEAIILKGVEALIDQAALKAARSALFEPGKVEGEPVDTWMVIPIEFKLH